MEKLLIGHLIYLSAQTEFCIVEIASISLRRRLLGIPYADFFPVIQSQALPHVPFQSQGGAEIQNIEG